MANSETQTQPVPGRFAVSESGMRELNSSREPWDLVKELIQNAWDEVPLATECRVIVKPQPDDSTTMVTVEDDGPGFSDIADAYTLMGHTKKRLDPTQRGRFNIGEKDVISVAIEAVIETAHKTVTFPCAGSRTVADNSRRKGTLVSVLMPWHPDQSSELVDRLQRFRCTNKCRLFVNDREVPPRPAAEIRSISLPTVQQDGPNQPMRTQQRTTDIHLIEPPAGGGERWLYEMGIPVQTIDCPWDVDVMQKIPLSQQRDAVSDAYLNRIYAEVLNAGHHRLEQVEFRSHWVKRAIEHPQITPPAVKATLKGRYGSDRVVLETLDGDANARARDAGYGVANPGALSDREIGAFRKHAGVKDSDEVFPIPPLPRIDYAAEPDSNQAKFADWVVKMSSHCNLQAAVRYFDEPGNARLADCSVDTMSPVLRFNAALLGSEFFEPPYGSIEHWNLLFHELGHALTVGSTTPHGEAWGDGVSKASAMIAERLLRNAAPGPAS